MIPMRKCRYDRCNNKTGFAFCSDICHELFHCERMPGPTGLSSKLLDPEQAEALRAGFEKKFPGLLRKKSH